MDVIIIESKAFQELIDRIDVRIESAVRKALSTVNSQGTLKHWLTLKEAQELLPYRSKTIWQKLRDSQEIEFAIFGRKILYCRDSIMTFIKNKKTKL